MADVGQPLLHRHEEEGTEEEEEAPEVFFLQLLVGGCRLRGVPLYLAVIVLCICRLRSLRDLDCSGDDILEMFRTPRFCMARQ